MSDLISRQAAIEMAVDVETPQGAYERAIYVDDLMALPSADAVEVVRCKDCRHRDLFSCPLTDNDFQKDEDYCSWGERKGGDSDG